MTSDLWALLRMACSHIIKTEDMTKIEKQMIIVVVVMIALIATLAYRVTSQIEEAGGVKAIVTEIAKDVKDVAREVSEHE